MSFTSRWRWKKIQNDSIETSSWTISLLINGLLNKMRDQNYLLFCLNTFTLQPYFNPHNFINRYESFWKINKTQNPQNYSITMKSLPFNFSTWKEFPIAFFTKWKTIFYLSKKSQILSSSSSSSNKSLFLRSKRSFCELLDYRVRFRPQRSTISWKWIDIKFHCCRRLKNT